jgi:uncharacterized RDD family membrane protein YckC
MTAARHDVTGQYAGAVTRFLANSIDVAIAGFLFLAGSAMLDYALRAIAGIEIETGSVSLGRTGAFGVWLFLYWWASIAVAAKTPGKALLGLRVLSRSGDILSSGRAALRAATLPLSYILFGAGFLGIVVSRERRALHDVIAGSVVVYDWGNRSAELPTPITAFLDRRSTKGAAADHDGS